MATRRVLVTGGAGFIASHLVDRLVHDGNEVTVLDSLEPQVHEGKRPAYLNPKAAFLHGDVRDDARLREAIRDKDLIFHQAAAVGVGQSMYEIARYVDTNTGATAKLLDLLARKEHSVRKLVVASSMSIYGEGLYACPDHDEVWPDPRPDDQLASHEWEQTCPECAKAVTPVPTPEWKPLESTSVYAISKKDQEEYSLVVGRAYGIPTVALRYFNVFGPRQSLSNPYTGVAAIFSSRLKNNNPPVVYEDGRQTRDFIDVRDIVQGNLLAASKSGADYKAVNIGTGHPTSILDVAQTLATLYKKTIDPVVENKFRPGDIRHCTADITRARDLLGFQPAIAFAPGMEELVRWGEKAEAIDRFDEAANELVARGLVPK